MSGADNRATNFAGDLGATAMPPPQTVPPLSPGPPPAPGEGAGRIEIPSRASPATLKLLGWHNDHHYSPASARQGHRWWQIDLTFAVLWLLEQLGVVRGLRRPVVPAAGTGPR